MPEQFSISTQAWNPGIFPPCRILISPRARASVVYRCGIHNAYLQFVCHQLAWYIILKFRFAEMLRRSIKMLSLVGRVAHLPDKAKQITALFDAAAVLQIGFKWKLSLWEYQAPWTIDQSDPCTFRAVLLQPPTPSPLWEPLYSETLSAYEQRYDWCRLSDICVSVDRIVLDTELKIGVSCDYNALYSTWCYLSITWEKILRASFILLVWAALVNSMRFVLSRGTTDLINLFDARLVLSFASTLPDFLAGNSLKKKKFKISHRL